MNKKAFSLSELVVALGVMAVLAAIMIPSMTSTLANKEKEQFVSAYNVVENAIATMINDESVYPAGNLTNTMDSQYFCSTFARSINTVTVLNCVAHTGTLLGASKVIDFETSNGYQWAGFASSTATDTWPKDLYVDVNGDDGPNALDEDVFQIKIASSGKITPVGTNAIQYLSH